MAIGTLTEAADATQTSVPRGRASTRPILPYMFADRYEALGVLGEGGMGRVYRAYDRKLDEVVALKVLHRELVDVPGMLERFRREVKLARRVTSPHVVRTFDLGEHGGDHFLTMELVEGGSLTEQLRAGALAQAEALRIARSIAAGIAAAHATAVLHRDLKPDNILVGTDGRIAITDFGIARIADGVSRESAQRLLGTPAYMAPEQVESRPDIGPAADVYALGAILFEMLTGQRPFGSDGVAAATARLTDAPPDPRALRPMPDAFAELVLRCLARDPADRYPDGRVLAQALAELDATAPAPVAPVSFTAPICDRDPELVELYFECYAKLRAGWLVGGVESLLLDLEAVRRRAPKHPRALAVLALAHARSAFYGGSGDLDRAGDLAARSLAAAPELGEALLAVGVTALYRGESLHSARVLVEALACAPRLAMAHAVLGAVALEAGALDTALPLLEHARSIDPIGWQIGDLPRAYVYAGRADDAERVLRETPTNFREVMNARFRMWRGEPFEAPWRLPAEGLPVCFESYASIAYRVLHTRKLDPDERRVIETTVRVPNPRLRATRAQLVAELYMYIGDVDAALDKIELGVASGLGDHMWFARCPLLDGLRGRTRFRELAAVVEQRARVVAELIEDALVVT